jgi:hypothetical protein
LISSKTSENEPFGEHLNDMMKTLNSAYDKFLETSKSCKAFLNCVISMHGGDKPFIRFDKKALNLLSELNAEIEFDIYNY